MTTTTGRTIEQEIFIHATPERVFRALTTKNDLERWFVTEATVDARPGGKLRLVWSDEGTVAGEFIEVSPPHRLVLTWDERPNYGITTMTFTLTPEGEGTRLHLLHTGFGAGEAWDTLFAGVQSGWTTELGNLRAWLDDGTPKAWPVVQS